MPRSAPSASGRTAPGRTDQNRTGLAAALRQAEAHRQAGRLAEAEDACRRALAIDAEDADALHALGLVALDAGQAEAALALVTRADTLAPKPIHASTLGRAHKALGRMDTALEWLAEAVRREPRAAEWHYNLGNGLLAAGRYSEAADAFAQAARLRPGWAAAHNNIALMHRALGDLASAETAARRATALAPRDRDTHANLALILADRGRPDEAAGAWAAAAALAPKDVDLLRRWEKALLAASRPGDAASVARRIVALRPDDPEAHYDLAFALLSAEQRDEALAPAEMAARLGPGSSLAHAVHGQLLRDAGRIDDALIALHRALAIDPASPRAQYGHGTTLLSLGRLAEGWDGYEGRWGAFLGKARFPTPPWDGETFPGRTLFVHAEQGLGDQIMAARYLPLAAARGGTVIVEHRAALRRLFSQIEGVRWQPDDAPPPPHDLHCPMMSLPRAFRTTLGTIPPAPYLTADPDETARWRTRLSALPGLRVGLFWTGNPAYPQDRIRSLPARHLPALRDAPGVSWVSLQPGAASPGWVVDWTRELADVAATAALVAALDLVVSVDTMVVHLAGALGRPVWLLNRFASDWRWMFGRDDSPWYPSLRQFRQPAPGDWGSVIGAVRAALAEIAGPDPA